MNENNKEKKETEVVEDYGEVMQKEYEFIPNALCHYKQRGIYLVCVSCELQHALFIGTDRFYVGDDENGRPILVEKKEYLKNGYGKYKKKEKLF